MPLSLGGGQTQHIERVVRQSNKRACSLLLAGYAATETSLAAILPSGGTGHQKGLPRRCTTRRGGHFLIKCMVQRHVVCTTV